jgi:hypothetical protein
MQRAASNLREVPADSARAHNGAPDRRGKSRMHAAALAEALTLLDEAFVGRDLDGAAN